MSEAEANGEPRRRSTRVKSIAYELEDERGVVKSYTVRELKGGDRDRFMNLMKERRQYDKEGNVVAIKDYTGIYCDLLRFALFDSEGKQVQPKDLQEFPASVQEELFKVAQDLSGLTPTAEEEAEKN